MLQQLYIQNFALIDKVEINFDRGLTVITGETGAGKSILLGALGLILGNRADHSTLKDTTRKCIVEGTFKVSGYHLEAFFEENDLDYSDLSTLRREINGSGKSRSFINDTPVTLEVIKVLGSRLIDIHSQQQSLQINDAQFQLNILDALAGNQELVGKYKQIYYKYKSVKSSIEQVEYEAAEAKKQEDYLNFQFVELESLALKEGENKNLEIEQNRFANSEEIIKGLSQAKGLLIENEENLIDQLSILKQSLNIIEKYDNSLGSISDRVNGALIELQDISNEIESKIEDFEYDPDRHLIIEERLGEIHRLQQKHLLTEADELIELKNNLEQQLLAISDSAGNIEGLKNELEILNKDLKEKASILSKNRLQVIPEFELKVQNTLSSLGISYAQLKIEYSKKESFTANGLDSFDFLFSANKGIAPEKISKTASGGEISRLMLAIKELLAENQQLPTILFDEIDTGVSGEIAQKMGDILEKMGQTRQVMSITHLPQLAAKGEQHYFVYKEVDKDKSLTKIKQLNKEGRVEELAKMLSGSTLTEAAMNNAKELLAL